MQKEAVVGDVSRWLVLPKQKKMVYFTFALKETLAMTPICIRYHLLSVKI
jgi:hypothetical protein